MAKSGTLEDLVDLVAKGPKGRRVQVPSGLVASQALYDALQAAPEACNGVVFRGLFIPGVNEFDYSALQPNAHMETPLMSAALRPGFDRGRVAPFRGSYLDMYRTLGPMRGDDIAIAVVSPLGGGAFSFGVAADAGPAVLRSGPGRRVALVNAALPSSPTNAPVASADDFDLLIEVDEPIAWIAPETPAAGTLARVAANAAALVNDGDSLQFGIGKLPGAILRHLTDRKGLTIHSGLYHDAVIDLLDAGALQETGLIAGVCLGTADTAARLVEAEAEFAPVAMTHDPQMISKANSFTALNGALQVDLFGQVNAEFIGEKLVSGGGGLPNFAAGARLSHGGRLIISLPALAGAESRIVPRLTCPWVTLPQGAAHMVVTENGVADLNGKTLNETAMALIAIADPSAQAGLAEAWDQFRKAL
jgi:acyl CoA:acetate/3-ketoacid CoA transferase beta subunit